MIWKLVTKTHFLFFYLASLIFLLYSFARFSHGVDIIRQGQLIRDGDALISGNEIFELGFFSPGNSTFRFVGIWYKVDVKAVVWVANRDKPISGRGGVLTIGADGNLVVLDVHNSLVWSSNVSGLLNNTAAILQNTGNFVLSRNESVGDTSRAHWQSFNHPTDTLLPEMRVPVAVNSAIRDYRAFRAWKSVSDPSPGNYTMDTVALGGPQIVISDQTRRRWRSVQWNSLIFTGDNLDNFLYGFKLSAPDENRTQYFTYVPSNLSDLLRFRIGWDGREEQLRWDDREKNWRVLQTHPDPTYNCELYNHCGNYATCDNLNSQRCNCLEGFRPKFPDQWSRGNWSGGSERKMELQCQRTYNAAGQNSKPDGFKGVKGMKLPDFSSLFPAGNLDACRRSCLENCLCSAYAFVSGIGCMVWTGDLVDMQHFEQSRNLQFFYRLPHSELEVDSGIKVSNLVIIIISLVGPFILVASLWLLWRYKKKLKVSSMPCCKDDDVVVFDVSKSKSKGFLADLSGPSDIRIDGNEVNGPELPIFNFGCVAAATNNFCEANRLGQGVLVQSTRESFLRSRNSCKEAFRQVWTGR
ncbi:hypothetical protein DITRI_Ditri02bG0022500 [Diplodiscus trichospermus]